jgi:hypothetical protein
MQINKSLIVILLFTISGCTSIPTTRMDYTPISVNSSNFKKINGTLVVKDLIDNRPPREFTQPWGKIWLTYVPLLPYVTMSYERLDETYDLGRNVKTRSLASIITESIANDIRSLGIFKNVEYIGDKNIPNDAEYVLSGKFISSEYQNNITSYCLGMPGVLLWYLPIPMGDNVGKIDLTLDIKTSAGKELWTYNIKNEASKLYTLYNSGGLEITKTMQMSPYGSNDEGIDENSIFSYYTAALRLGMVDAKKSLLQKLSNDNVK